MKKLIVLTGLVSVEKSTLTLELAEHFSQNGNSVTVLDNIARLPIDVPDRIPSQRITGDIIPQLPQLLRDISAEIVLLAVSEQAHPEQLFVSLDTLQSEFDTMNIQTFALIDLRTCDCFPQVRQQLELYADAVIMLPYSLDEVLNHDRTP